MSSYEDYLLRREKEETEDMESLTDVERKEDEQYLSEAYNLTYIHLGRIMDLGKMAHGKRTRRLIHNHAVHEYHLEEASCGIQ